ncbi:MarR family winged helix-turn-helix transcriptional regulator [Nocardia goodfellowii]
MDKRIDSIERETMLLGRYSQVSAVPGRAVLDRRAYTLLNRLRAEGAMSIGQLRDALGQDTSTLNRQTAALLRIGLVERIPDPDGGMARKFRLTDEGAQKLDVERDQRVAHLSRIMSEWSPEEVATFASYLERYNADIERYHGRPWPR